MKLARSVGIALAAAVLFFGCTRWGGLNGAAVSPVLNRIQQKGELVVGTMGAMPPLNMTTRDGRIIGLEPDLARLMANAMGVKVRFVKKPFAALLPALETGALDIVLSGMTITGERNLKVAFVGPYFISGKAFLTKAKRLADAKRPEAVNRPQTKLVVLQGSTSQKFAEKYLDQATLYTAATYDAAVHMVLDGRAQALLADYPICVVSVFRYPNAGLLSVITPLTYEPIGMALPAGDPLLVNWMENFLNALEHSGKLDELKLKWFTDGAWLKKLPEPEFAP